MFKTQIHDAKPGPFGISLMRTDISQRDSLEKIIVNLCTCLGIVSVQRTMDNNGHYYYEPKNTVMGFQSATNTILALSEMLLENHKEAAKNS